MYITNRERKILDIFLRSQYLHISIEEIAKELDLSNRTIQREIKNIEATLEKLDLYLEKQLNKGLKIKGKEESLKNLDKIINSPWEQELSSSERIIIIFYKLMMSLQPLKTKNLSNEFLVSNKMILEDLADFEQEIKEYPLTLIRKRGYGLELLGSEKDKRIALVNMMMQRLEKSSIYSIEGEHFIYFNTEDKILGIMDLDIVLAVEKPILEEIENLPYRIIDYSILELILYLSISIERIKMDFPIIKTRTIEDKGVEYQVAERIINRINEETRLDIPKGEIQFFAQNLRGAKRSQDFNILENKDLNHIAINLIELVSERTGYYFHRDISFIQGLISHLEPLFNRVREGIFVDNPIIDEIKEEYFILFNAIKSILIEEFPEFYFSEDEVGFLTIHFASIIPVFREVPKVSTLVVCGSGIGTSRILSKRLLNEFPQLTIIEQASIRELANMDTSSFDLIISTVGLYDACFEYVLVNPMLTNRDKLNLEKIVNKKLLNSSRLIKDYRNTMKGNFLEKIELIDLMNIIIKDILKDFKVLNISCNNLEEVLLEIEDNMRECNISTYGYVSQLLREKEERIGSGIPDSTMTFLHGRSQEIQRSFFRIYRNDKKMEVKSMDSSSVYVDTILILMAPENLNRLQLDIISSISVTLLDRNIRKIYISESEKRVFDYLENQLKLSYMEQIEKLWRD